MRKKITLVLTGNGSVEVLEEEEEEEGNVWNGAALGLILIIGALFNLTLIGVATTTKHKRNLFQLVTALGFVNAYDSIVNQTILLLFVLEMGDKEASPPNFLCRFSLVSSLLSLLLQFFYVACVSISSLSRKRRVPLVLLIMLPPVISSILVVPPAFLEGQIPIFYFIDRFSCGMTGDSLFYSIFLLVVGFGTSISAIVYFLFVIKCYFCSATFAWNSDSEPREQRYVASLLLLCLVTLVPSTVFMNVTNFIHSGSLKKIATSSVPKIATGRYETALVFLKSQFNVLSPLLFFVFFKEFRKQFSSLFCFCRKNSVSSDLKMGATSKRAVSEEGTPVLFCTPNGLVLKGPSNESEFSFKNCDRCYQRESFVASIATDISIKVSKPKTRMGPKRKIVRFAHYVKEIPPSFTEWGETSENEGNSDS